MITIKKIRNKPTELFVTRIWHKGLCIAETECPESYGDAVERAKKWAHETGYGLSIHKLEAA